MSKEEIINYHQVWNIIHKTDLLNYDEKDKLHLFLMNFKDNYKELQQRIDKAINDIQTTFQIISEQPSRNVEEDNYILSRLESFLKTLGGDVDDE